MAATTTLTGSPDLTATANRSFSSKLPSLLHEGNSVADHFWPNSEKSLISSGHTYISKNNPEGAHTIYIALDGGGQKTIQMQAAKADTAAVVTREHLGRVRECPMTRVIDLQHREFVKFTRHIEEQFTVIT